MNLVTNLRSIINYTLSIAILLIAVQQLNAQKLNHVQGQFIVQLDADKNVKIWINDFNKAFPYSLTIHKKISPVLNVYTVDYDFTQFRQGQVHTDLLMYENVEIAQLNHFVELRSTIPNDPEFQNQWQYINMGQDGGVEGADIDMDLAWDFATGGITAEGDTIVACIIDDGIDNNHPDIQPNLFINYAEIPGNGIDDDGNGFVDDVRGWDTGSSSDEVYDGGGHGTPVTGIIGAKGNEGFGVAGVNWNVKLMIVQGGTGVESEVIEAYSYPLTFRKKYNETNGAEGAFVVSTNASWGTDFGQPEDAPIWCAFYDTLGAAGIISCGATINGNQNIDEVGDLPTACTSDYLIAVTNMNRTDVKVTGAGYGITTIDLGAFGQDTWTVTSGGGFGGFGGTSGATPHVTGSVALLYSIPCPNLISLAKSNPGQAALLVKNAILDGVDPNESLEGITVTGGRLNVHNAIQELLQNHCGDCLAPFIEETEISENNSVQVSWTLNDTTEFVDLRWREVGITEWIEVANVSNSFNFTDLELCTDYEYQLRSSCTNSMGEYGITNIFTSFGCCVNPDEFNVNSFDIIADFSWTSVPAAQSYNIRYRIVGSTDWAESNTLGTIITLDDLEACSQYEAQIQSVCLLAPPNYSESINFFTLGCDDPCTELPYCEVVGYNGSEEYITLVQVGDLKNETQSDGGYGQFVSGGPTTDLGIGGSYIMTLTPGFAGTMYNEFFKVWIDFNQNSIVEEEEIVIDSDNVQESFSTTITIPESALLGNTRMRVAMRYNQSAEICVPGNFQDFGEVEDYCINITEFTCPINNGLDTISIQANQAIIQWSEDPNSDNYSIRYKKVTDTEWISDETDELNISIESLETCTDYEFQVRNNCTQGEGDFSNSLFFKTSCISNINLDQENQINIYPNPFASQFTINFESLQSNEDVEYYLVNQLGQVQKSGVINVNSQSLYTLKTGNLISGIYYLRLIQNDQAIRFHKIIKTK